MAEQQRQAVLLFGPPGSGKGTQGEILGRIPGFHHVSMGDVFRGLDRGSPLGRVFAEYSGRGELVPDDVTIGIWRQHMRSAEAANRYQRGGHLLILDGIPRNVNQARLLEAEADVQKVVRLTCSDEEAMVARLRGRALKQGRADDAREDVVRRRLDIYREETEPVLACYPRERIVSIEALGTPAEVLTRILEQLAPLQRSLFGNILAAG